MNKSEKEIIYSKICMVEKLLEEYENYLSENSKKLLRRQSILRAFCGGGLLLSLGVFAFGIFNLIFGGYRSATGILLTLISICFAIGLFITVVMISAFYLNSNENYLSTDEYDIYKNNKSTFALIDELKFPKDYLCSGFAKTVLAELDKDSLTALDKVYLKCRSVNFDILKDSTAEYIITNRNFICKIKNYMGIVWTFTFIF